MLSVLRFPRAVCLAAALALAASASSGQGFGPETFEGDAIGSVPAEWMASGTGLIEVALAEPPSGNRALRLSSRVQGESTSPRRLFDELSLGDAFVFSLDWRAQKQNQAGLVLRLSTANVNNYYLRITSASGRNAFELSNDGGSVIATDSLDSQNRFTVGNWYRFEVSGVIGNAAYEVLITDRGTDNAGEVGVYFDTADLASAPAVDRSNEAVSQYSGATYPGQSPSGHYVDIDNVSLVVTAPPAGMVTVDPFVRRMVEGVSGIVRQNYFNIHNRYGTMPSGNEEALMIDQLGANWGRDMWLLDQGLPGVAEDPARDGYADPSYFDVPRGPYQSYGRQGILAPDLNMLLCVKLYPEFMEVKGDSFPGTPNDPDAAAELMVNIFDNWEQYSDNTPKLFEVHNESDIESEWTHHFDPDAWDKLILHHNTVADAVKASHPQIKVGGPTLAFPQFARNDFRTWLDRTEKFIPETAASLDFFSLHTYDTIPSTVNATDPVGHKCGERQDAIIDLIEARYIETVGEVKPFVVSEFASLARNHPGSEELQRWFHARAITTQMPVWLSMPHRILKAVPFVITHEDYVEPYIRLFINNGFSWVETKMVDLFRMWAGLEGDLVEITLDSPDARAVAMVDGQTLWVYVVSLADVPLELGLDTGLSAGDVTSVEIRRLGQSGGEIDYTVSNVPFSTLDPLQLSEWESVVLKIDLAETHAWSGETDERAYDTGSTVDEIGSSPLSYTIDVPADVLADSVRARLRVSLGRAFGKAQRASSVTMNGVALPEPKTPLTNRHAGEQEYFGTTTYEVPLAQLAASNSLQLTFPDQGGRVSSVRLVVTEDASVAVCVADLDPPGGDGALGFFDLVAYLTLFAANDPAADLDPPGGDGALGFFDLVAYLTLFAAGCP